ncbi:Putative SANT/Myb domain, Homeobox-like domain superfamily protein [Septoria linicola]|uniref:SANT/Myb domain, Homeobox-like domain superfamily protein n=1 Tax=Septoria linicola TaxID=215465 RepID=A0A9Q9EHD6_9PEZI|nr:Putative SANT/Myb domain, Homeobox-like domain superfamily protein [Septoria linicola]
MYTNSLPYSHQQHNQQQNAKPNLTNQNTYSASPSQLTLPSDLQSNLGGLPNPYQQQYSYLGSPHDPTGSFGFPPYRPLPLQTHHTPLPQPQHLQQISPTNSRKRRASELDGLPGSSSSNASVFGNPVGLLGGPGDLDQGGLGASSQPPPPNPPVKKGRTNTPWTPAEELRLKQLRDQGSSWSEIAKTFPTRTEGSVKKHWYKDMHYAEFAEDESAALLQAIKDYETNKWKVIGQKVGKPAKACEQFAKEQGWKI